MSESVRGKKGGSEKRNNRKKIGSCVFAKSEKIFIEASDAHKSTKAHRAEEGEIRTTGT